LDISDTQSERIDIFGENVIVIGNWLFVCTTKELVDGSKEDYPDDQENDEGCSIFETLGDQ